jgi:hypothetical protein
MDTFFKWYFIIVGALFIISFFLKKLECPKEDVLVEGIVDDVCSWFYSMYPLRKKSPRIVISGESSDYEGTYTFYNNTITLFTKNVSNYESIVEITLHELVHWREITSLSKDQLYDRQLKEYGYEKHPQEIWCRAVAAELTKQYIKQKM